MADTSRSKADILTLFADNIIGALSEQDLRDFVMSALGGFSSMTVINGSTAQTTTATPAKMTGWSANGLEIGCSADHANAEITIDVDGVYEVHIDVCFSGTNSKTYLLAVYKDVGAGFVDAGVTRVKRKLGTGGDVGSSHCHGRVNLAATDKVCAYIWSSDGGTSLTPQEATISVKRVS